jgi:hypothetical protein
MTKQCFCDSDVQCPILSDQGSVKIDFNNLKGSLADQYLFAADMDEWAHPQVNERRYIIMS